MKWRSLVLLVAAFIAALPAIGSELRTAPSAVLELFTSEGCPSCPPADALFAEIAERADVIALAYHVDYWDYIGWRDTFGSPAFSDYQRAYAARGKNSLYTPQVMVNGTTNVVGSRRAEVTEALAAAHLPIPLSIDERDDMIAVTAAGDMDYASARLWLVTFKNKASVEITHGENRDRTLCYSNIATSRQIIGMWDQKAGVSLTLPVVDLLGSISDGAAILIQEDIGGKPGRILGAISFLR